MNARILGWFVFLASVKHLSCSAPFELEGNTLPATEGSCIELLCKVTRSISDYDAYWFWMKDAQWIEDDKDYSATIVYSTNNVKRPVSPEFAGRVQYVGSPSSDWTFLSSFTPKPRCSILICNLNKSDSGEYLFRFIGPNGKKWATEEKITLTVTENQCPITFEKQPVVKENDMITLTCSTSGSCASSPQIQDLSNLPQTQFNQNNTHKSTSVSFTATWQDDGREFTCQEKGNEDKYLLKNIHITVEYPPTEISSTISPEPIKEGDSVTLTCFARGNPTPTFTWFRTNDVKVKNTTSSAEWNIPKITEQQTGQYYCQAENKYGTRKSNSVTVNVKFPPDVEITSSPATVVREGNTVTLRCNVKRSNPPPHTYSWEKDEKPIDTVLGNNLYVRRINPDDRGNYRCKATNTVGTGTSTTLLIEVQYHPRKTKISLSESVRAVKVGGSLTLTCDTDALPAPHTYSWSSYNHQQTDSPRRTSTTHDGKRLYLKNVQRGDDACYSCNATNSIGTGPNSEGVCISVLYPPTEPVLSMATEVTENQTVTLSCSVESVPASTLSLTRTSTSETQPHELSSSRCGGYWPNQPSNQLNCTFTATSGDAGHYTCKALNSEGSNQRLKSLVVKYAPKDVTIKGEVEVDENKSLTLSCTAKSYKRDIAFSWMKEESNLTWKTQNFTVNSVGPSDSGTYRCSASNDIGTTRSQATEVKVKYAPKLTTISQSTEQQHPDGRSSVNLTCSSQCYPPVAQYIWYREDTGTRGVQPQTVHYGQTYRVYSDQPGVYYCVAKNAINEKQSDPIHLFDGTFAKYLKLSLCLILILLIVIIFVFVYRRRKNNSAQHRTVRHCFGFLGASNAAWRGPVTQRTFLAEPSRSRDDLLPDGSHRPEAQRQHPAPDSTPASDFSTVYSVVKLPQNQAASAQKPTGGQGGLTVADSPNYASLQFGNKTNNKQLKPPDDVYAKVHKSNPNKKNEKEWLTDYENIGATVAAKASNPLDDDTDTDTSDDDVQLTYTQVSFTVNPGHQRPSRDSSSSEDFEIQYSDIKI